MLFSKTFKRTKKDTGWLTVMNPFKKSARSTSPRYRFYVSTEDLEGEFEEDDEDEMDASSRSFEEGVKERMARAVSAEDLLDKDDDARRVSRRRVWGGFSKSMDELDAIGGFSPRSRSYDDPLDQSDGQEPSKEKSPRLQQQSVSEPGPKSLERGRGVGKTLRKALPWIQRSSKLWVRGSPMESKTPFDFVSKRPGEVFNVPVDLYAIWAITGKA